MELTVVDTRRNEPMKATEEEMGDELEVTLWCTYAVIPM
jgi:hypothetical protein